MTQEYKVGNPLWLTRGRVDETRALSQFGWSCLELRRGKALLKQSNDLSGPRSRAESPRHTNNAAEHRVLRSLWRELLLPNRRAP